MVQIQILLQQLKCISCAGGLHVLRICCCCCCCCWW